MIKTLKTKQKLLTIDKNKNNIILTGILGGEFMDIKKKEALLKANLQIFDELNPEDINYVLGYVSGLVKAKELLKKHIN